MDALVIGKIGITCIILVVINSIVETDAGEPYTSWAKMAMVPLILTFVLSVILCLWAL